MWLDVSDKIVVCDVDDHKKVDLELFVKLKQ